MTIAAWAQRFSIATASSALLILGIPSLSYAQTNTFDPPDPGQPIPNSGGLTFSGFVSATGGAGGSVASSNGTATVTPLPPNTLLNFFGVNLSKPTGSNVNFIQIQAFLSGSLLYTQTVNVSTGSQSFRPSALGLPATVSSLTFTGFATSPASLSAFSALSTFDEEPLALASFSVYDSEYGRGYGSEYDRGYGKQNIKRCGYKRCDDVFFIDDLEAVGIPEPTSMLGLLVASGGIVALKRRNAKKSQEGSLQESNV